MAIHWLSFILLACSGPAYAIGIHLAPKERLVSCMQYLGVNDQGRRRLDVIQMDPAQSKRWGMGEISRAVLLVDHEMIWGHVVGLRAVGKEALEGARESSFSVYPGEVVYAELNPDEYNEFQLYLRKLGSITMVYSDGTGAERMRTPRIVLSEFQSVLTLKKR